MGSVNALKNGGAPGPDELPPELFKKCLKSDGENYFSEALFTIIRKIWLTGEIPEAWQAARIVSIFKKNDPTDRGNYRGISLIAVALKILSAIVARRVSKSVEETHGLAREQGGFRSKEEAIAQVIALIEVASRRRRVSGVEGEEKGDDDDRVAPESLLMFYDLKKAFDTVPHGALFYKLQKAGITPRCMRFIKALYATSKVHVRRPDGEASRNIDLLRGVRQGCPLSPVLFLIFMNDIFDCPRAAGLGVNVPGHSPVNDKLLGLMFADDVVTISSSPEDLVRMKDHMEQWATTWGMRWGVPKCGIMLILSRRLTKPQEKRRRRIHTEHFSGTPEGALYGIQVPLVESYKYLGVDIPHSLDLASMARQRVVKGRGILCKMAPFIRSKSVPLAARVAMVRAIGIATMLYGGELWGTSRQRADPAHVVVKMVMRWLVGAGKHVAIAPLHMELNIPPPYAEANARAARLWVKCAGLRTWLGELIRDDSWKINPIRNQSWTNRVFLWLCRFVPKLETPGLNIQRQGQLVAHLAVRPEGAVAPVDWQHLVPGREAWIQIRAERQTAADAGGETWLTYVKERVKVSKTWYKAVLRRAWTIQMTADFNSVTWDLYKRAGFVRTRLSKLGTMFPLPSLGAGMEAIVKVRLRRLWTSYRHFRITREGDPTCLFCNSGEPETLSHLFLRCTAWSVARACWLKPLIAEARRVLARRGRGRYDDKVILLLAGGQIGGKSIRDWELYLPRDRAEANEAPPAAEIVDPKGKVLAVARFLQEVIRLRDMRTGWPL
jgi:hypothetical protein